MRIFAGLAVLASGIAVTSCVPNEFCCLPITNVTAVSFSDTLDFDKALHSTLKGNTAIVTVAMPDPKVATVASLSPGAVVVNEALEVLVGGDLNVGSHRLAPWVNVPAVAGRKTHWCSTEGVARGYMGIATEVLAKVLKYEPARDYSAVVVYDSADRVQYVRFVHNAPDTMTCADAIAMAPAPS
ncbi:hypothetical protein [Brevundimonas sp.]|uniref:hypothetical protein n=1 Tax=Brevundimonas sp. TaxID=1871086 RepID=UPI001DC8BEBF|nr:hypothetical protein [Brevundimonas sp.]MBL0947452.1 hypothetical protein [Brevundimonas sp.]